MASTLGRARTKVSVLYLHGVVRRGTVLYGIVRYGIVLCGGVGFNDVCLN